MELLVLWMTVLTIFGGMSIWFLKDDLKRNVRDLGDEVRRLNKDVYGTVFPPPEPTFEDFLRRSQKYGVDVALDLARTPTRLVANSAPPPVTPVEVKPKANAEDPETTSVIEVKA